MGTFLHRTTKEYFQSIPPDQLAEPIANYIDNPDMSAVVGVPSKYWQIIGDIVSEMDAGEKAVVDQAILDVQRDSLIAAQVDGLESVLRQLIKLTISEINILRNQFNETTAEVPQLTTTTFADRTVEQFKNKLRSDLGT